MKAVKDILAEEGTSVEEMDINENYTYESDTYHDLTIEKVYENVVSVEQHYTQRMDRMSDPEVRFDVSDPEDWTPIEFRQDPGVYDRDEDGIDTQGFLSTWNKNLQDQFPAEEVAGGDQE